MSNGTRVKDFASAKRIFGTINSLFNLGLTVQKNGTTYNLVDNSTNEIVKEKVPGTALSYFQMLQEVYLRALKNAGDNSAAEMLTKLVAEREKAESLALAAAAVKKSGLSIKDLLAALQEEEDEEENDDDE